MNVDVFSNWLRKQGYHIYKSASSYWYNAGPRVLQAFPYHWVIQPSASELRKLLLGRSILALRYSAPIEFAQGMISYHVVLKNPYNLEMLRSQARNGVRRGLSHCQVERIPLKRLADEGWKLQQDTLERQDRLKSMRQSEWERICLSAEGLPGFEAWGAIVDGELTASILTCRIDDTCYVPYAQSLSKFLGMHVNNALFYTASCDMLARSGVTEIFYSLHSLDAPETINEFKFRMGFNAKPVRQCIVFHPVLLPFANGLTHRWLLGRLQRDPGNNTLAKAEGMLRFYLQGKLPLKEQAWPECLAATKEEALQAGT